MEPQNIDEFVYLLSIDIGKIKQDTMAALTAF